MRSSFIDTAIEVEKPLVSRLDHQRRIEALNETARTHQRETRRAAIGIMIMIRWLARTLASRLGRLVRTVIMTAMRWADRLSLSRSLHQGMIVTRSNVQPSQPMAERENAAEKNRDDGSEVEGHGGGWSYGLKKDRVRPETYDCTMTIDIWFVNPQIGCFLPNVDGFWARD